MEEKNALVVFQDRKIRRAWPNEEWFYSVADIVAILSESEDARNYWKVLKHRLKKEGSEVVTDCNQLKMPTADGKLQSALEGGSIASHTRTEIEQKTGKQ